jgi:DNA-binding GntR family transcriptional regulator
MLSHRSINRPDSAQSMYPWSPRVGALTLSLPEQIAEKIGNSIVRGDYEPGARVPEVEVSTMFGVSRAPVREALRILERDGLVQINKGRGAQVTKLSIDEINEMFVVRASLLGLATSLAVNHQDPAFLQQLRLGVERLTNTLEGKDTDEIVGVVYELTSLLVDHSRNKVLRRILFSLAYQTLRYARLGLATAERRTQAVQDWRKLLDAAERKRPKSAQKMAEKLARDVRDTVVQVLRSTQERVA